MQDWAAPFFANDNGDISPYDSVDDMIAMIEAIDALDATHEFFDANGLVLIAVPDSERWHPTRSNDEPQPERLKSILQTYFARLPDHLAEFRARAESAGSLAALVALRQELAMRPRRGFLERLLRRARPS
ncbi:MAG: hypothetical protein QOI54_2029 [Actinomycetota bacterium]|jgi:hypothetical protein|nr:hypothetical protein [Actinomycetota bacterium]